MAMQETLDIDAVHKLIGKKKALGKRDGSRYGKRHTPGEMNATETKYSDYLEGKKLLGEILEWIFEPCSWRYAKDARFKSDFLILWADQTIEFVDVKGCDVFNEASTCRAKACAERFWMFTFSTQIKLPRKGGWKRVEH